MTDKFPWAPAKLRYQQASSLYQAKSTYSAERKLLYELFFVLYLLFWFLTRIEPLVTSIYALQANIQQIYEKCHAIESRRKLSLLAYGPKSLPFSFALFALCHYYYHIILIISEIKNAIRVRIHCRKLANLHIHHWGSVSKQTKSIKDSITKHQSLFSHGGSWRNRPIRIGLADVREPSSIFFSKKFSLEPITKCINSRCNGCAFFLPDVISNSEFDTNL
jgi:hypothetical protein